MKYLSSFFTALLSLVLMGGGMTGCSDDPEVEPTPYKPPVAELKVGEVSATSARLTLTTANVLEYAWSATDKIDEAAPAADVLFANGTKATAKDGDNTIAATGLNRGTAYKAYVAYSYLNEAGVVAYTVLSASFQTTSDFGEPMAEISVGDVTPISAVVTLTAKNLLQYAWVLTTDMEEEAPTPVLLFANGTKADALDGENKIELTGLEGSTDYRLFLAYTYETESGTQYGEKVLSQDFTTQDFTGLLTVVNLDFFSIKFHINVPEGKTIGYAVVDRDRYVGMQQFGTIAPSYLSQQKEIVDVLTESATVDWKGWVEEDYETGELSTQVPVPGQSLVLIVAEVVEGEPDGWGRDTWSVPFDYEGYYAAQNGGDFGPLALAAEEYPEDTSYDEFWLTDYAKVLFVHAKYPEKTDATVKVEVLSNTSKSISFKLTPDKELVGYGFTYMENGMFEEIVKNVGSEESAYTWITLNSLMGMETEPTTVSINDELELGRDYRLIIIGKGNEEGTLWNIVKYAFEAKPATKDAPRVEVKAISAPDGEPESPYIAWFNIKAPNKDVYRGRYAMNSIGEFVRSINGGSSYEKILASGNALSAADISAINSEAGFNVKFDGLLDDYTYRLVVSLANDEDTFSLPNMETEGEGWADCRTMQVPAEPAVSSSLFTDLAGDWTATAKLMKYDYSAGWVLDPNVITTKVTIRTKTEVPALTPDVIALYKDEASAREAYENFTTSAANFDQRLKNQNRMICDGLQMNSMLKFQSAWDLFISPSYGSAYDTDELFYDYGPKWELQIAQGDEVTVVADYTTQRPASAFQGMWYTYYMAGVSQDGKTTRAMSFNTTVSDDHKTLTILPTEIEGKTFYLTAGTLNATNMSVGAMIGEMTLTKGWTDASTAAMRMSKPAAQNNAPTIPTDFTPVRPHAKTPFNRMNLDEACKTVVLKKFDPEQIRAAYRKNAR